MARSLSPYQKYSRKNNIIYCLQSGLAIIGFTQNFIDLEILSVTAIDYINNYCEMFPQLTYDPKTATSSFEKIDKIDLNNQLSFF